MPGYRLAERMSPSPEPADPSQPAPPERLWRHLVGEQLRGVRHSRGDTLRDVAGKARVSPQYLSEIERGSKEPSSEILAAVGGALDLTLLDLASGVADRLQESSRATTRGDVRLAA